MSTISKQWLQQKIADMEATRDDIPFGLGEDGTNTLAALRIALASLEAEAVGYIDAEYTDLIKSAHIESCSVYSEPGEGCIALYTAPPAPANAEPVAWLWSHRKHPSEVTLVRPEDDEMAEGSGWSGWSCQALYAAQPVPVSVPDESAVELLATDLMKRIDKITGERHSVATLSSLRVSIVEACRAAMLQGAEPVQGWIPCSKRMPTPKTGVMVGCWFGREWAVKWATYIPSHPEANSHGFIMPGGSWEPTHWMPLPAAPQQEA